MSLERAQQDQEFAQEITQSRQAQRGQDEEESELRQIRKARPQAPHLAQVARLEPLLQFSAEDEQTRSADAMRQNLHHHTLQRDFRPREDPQYDEAHVTD